MCTVYAVDIVRGVCKCRSDFGEMMSDVRWVVPAGSSDGYQISAHPVEGSRVLVDTSTGFPIILGTLLADSSKDIARPNIGKEGDNTQDIADYTVLSIGDYIRGTGTPKDIRGGDIVTTTDGGGMQGVLRSGTVINKASSLAQLILSRYGDLGRMITRNWEHFTDVDATYKTSIRGKIFTTREIYRNPVKSRAEEPNLVRYEGDVAWAETLNKDYASYTAEDFPTEPTVSEDVDLVAKEYTLDDDNMFTSTWWQNIRGELHRVINNPDETITSTENRTSSQRDLSLHNADTESDSVQTETAAELKKEVLGGLKTEWRMNEEEFYWSVNEGGTKIVGNADGVVIDVEGNVVINLSSDGNISISNTGNTSINTSGTMDVTAKDTTFNLGNCEFNTSGTTTFNSSGNFKVTAPIIELN